MLARPDRIGRGVFRANHPALLTPSHQPSLSLSVSLSLPTAVPATIPAAPVVVPTRVTCPRINTATDRRPDPIRPSSQPASQPPPAPPTFHVTHPLTPFSSADSHSGFAAPSHANPPPLPPHTHPRAILRVFLFPSLSPSQASTAVALFLFVPLPFLFLLTSLLTLRLAHPRARPSFVIPPAPLVPYRPSTCRKV